MRKSRNIIAGSVLLVLLAGAVAHWAFPSGPPYRRFRNHSPAYFTELAEACDSLSAQRPTGTNLVHSMSGNDPALPAVIRGLGADEIRVYPNRVWIGIGGDEKSFAVLWEPAHDAANHSWVLLGDYDGVLETVHSSAGHDEKWSPAAGR